MLSNDAAALVTGVRGGGSVIIIVVLGSVLRGGRGDSGEKSGLVTHKVVVAEMAPVGTNRGTAKQASLLLSLFLSC